MTILAVDDSCERLNSLAQLLRRTFPEHAVIAQKDPLAAGKYSFNNPVDMLFAAIRMPRLDGMKLVEFVRHSNPKASVFLIAEHKSDAAGGLWADELDGLLAYPVTETLLRDALHQAQHNSSNSEKEMERQALSE